MMKTALTLAGVAAALAMAACSPAQEEDADTQESMATNAGAMPSAHPMPPATEGTTGTTGTATGAMPDGSTGAGTPPTLPPETPPAQ